MCELYQSVASHTPPTGDLAQTAGMCPDWGSNWRLFSSQAGTQPTEQHQSGLGHYRYITPLSDSTLSSEEVNHIKVLIIFAYT